MPTLIPANPSRKPSTRRPSRSAARKPAADKKARRGASIPVLDPGSTTATSSANVPQTGADLPASHRVPGKSAGTLRTAKPQPTAKTEPQPTSTPPAVATAGERASNLSTLLTLLPTLRGFDRELHAFLCSLTALVEQVERTARSQATLVVAHAVRSVLVVAANYAASRERGKLTANSGRAGSLAFLEWIWRGKQGEAFDDQPLSISTDHSDPVRDFVDDLRALLDKHKPTGGQLGEGPFADLYEAVGFARIMGAKHLLGPTAVRPRPATLTADSGQI